ncbi:macrolide ABC transporter ATP-binding protein [Bifidobacterium breve]|uniref:macrolide ABC transporter ATP-binding protein n=1 Tax=Bifidobacterium breve TaxID=1685 RepID=UPI0022DF4116|nr:macrolide ABC transporter ATP-binding protein [Bifidobacterium breve]
MNLTPRPRDLTALLNSDRTEPADTGRPESVETGRPESVETGIPKNRRTVKPNDAEGWVKTSVSLRASTRRRLKTWAAEHDMRIQEVVDAALETYLGLNGGE